MNSNTLLDERANLLKDLGGTVCQLLLTLASSQEDDRGGTVADLGVLRARNVNERARGRVHNVEELEQCCAVVCMSANMPRDSSLNKTDALEMVALPRSSTISLSMPRGPRVVAIVCATARHAEMLLRSCGVPWDESVPSESQRRVS